MSTPNEKQKKEMLQRVPTRKLLASIRKDIRRALREQTDATLKEAGITQAEYRAAVRKSKKK